MNDYYGVSTPTETYLAHYGIKGMKWGVRKAIEKGNTKALDRHYRKAAKKLEKLSQRTDIELQKRKADKYNTQFKAGRVVGRVGLGATLAGTGANHLIVNVGSKQIKKLDLANYDKVGAESRKLYDDAYKAFGISRPNITDHLKDIKNESDARKFKELLERKKNISDLDTKLTEEHRLRLKKQGQAENISNYIRTAGIGTALGGYGYAAASKIKSNIAKKRTTKEGHAKAVADRDAWRNQMAETFKGTKYANLPSVPKKKKRR